MKRYVVIGIVLIPALLTGCSSGKTDTAEQRNILVKVMEVKTSNVTDHQNYVGIIEEIFSSSLSFEVSGNVSNIYVREGEKVKKGQLIANLTKTTYQNNYDAALSVLKQAEDTYSRMKQLFENNSLPEIKWVEIQTSLQQAKSAEATALKKLNDCQLYAPFSGVISERNIESGTNVMPGMPAFNLIAIDKIKVKIAIPEKEINGIRIGEAADITIAALGDRQFSGQISEKNVTANPLSHTYDVKIILENPTGELMPGMVCKVNINPDHADKKEIIIPAHVIQVSHTGGCFVWLAVDNQAKRRTVSTKGFTDHGVIITDGLQGGEQIIVEGNQKVSEGMKLIIK